MYCTLEIYRCPPRGNKPCDRSGGWIGIGGGVSRPFLLLARQGCSCVLYSPLPPIYGMVPNCCPVYNERKYGMQRVSAI